MKGAKVLILMLCTARIAHCSDILVVTMADGRSHAGSMVPLLAELVHQENTQDITSQFIWSSMARRSISVTVSSNGTLKSPSTNFYYGSVSCGQVVAEHRDEFLRISKYPWDLILADSLFSNCGYGLALLARAKHLMIHTTSVEAAQGLAKGYARQYAASPPFFMRADDARHDVKNFLDRLYLTHEWYMTWFMVNVAANFFMRQTLAPVVPQFDFMTFNSLSSMSFTDMPLQLSLPESITNELFSYGAYCKRTGNLTGELVDFVNDPHSRGTILLAFGTLVDWKGAPEERREAFVQALNQLPEYRIIWACRNCPEMKLRSHIRLSAWVPQQELLTHPHTKLFITHGGLKSMKEAVCAKMPTLFLPVFGEQVRNAWLAKHHGYGQIINKLNVTAEYLLSLIQDMVTNPSYKRRAEKIRRCFEDAPISALQEGALRIKRLIKYGGRMPEYFYTRCTSFTYLRYLNLDLILLIPALIFFLLMTR